jgi:hypothetical protein
MHDMRFGRKDDLAQFLDAPGQICIFIMGEPERLVEAAHRIENTLCGRRRCTLAPPSGHGSEDLHSGESAGFEPAGRSSSSPAPRLHLSAQMPQEFPASIHGAAGSRHP